MGGHREVNLHSHAGFLNVYREAFSASNHIYHQIVSVTPNALKAASLEHSCCGNRGHRVHSKDREQVRDCLGPACGQPEVKSS